MLGIHFRFPFQLRIRSYLTVLVLLCLVPVCISSAYLVHHTYRNKIALLEQNLLTTAHILSVALDRDLAICKASLDALATSPALSSGDMATFHSQVLNALKNFPDSDIILADATGQQIINSYKPYGSGLPKRGSLTTVRRIFETGLPIINNVFKGAVTGRYLIGIDIPVYQDGQVRYDLGMTLPADRFLALLHPQGLPDTWVLTILDSDNTIVARSSSSEMYTGKHIESLPPLQLMAGASQGTTEGANKEGVPSAYSYKRSETTRWAVLVSVPKAVMVDELKEWLLWTLAGLSTLLVFGLGLGLGITRIITRSVQDLIEPALALGRGETVLPAGNFALVETSEVARSLVYAANLLRDHDAARKQVETTLKELNDTLEERIVERTTQLSAANERLQIEIADRKKAEELLQSTLQRFYHMFSSMYSGILLMTDEGRIEFVNQAFCDAYELQEAPADLIGLQSRDLLQMILPAFRNPDEAAIRILDILQRGEPVRTEEFAMNRGRTALRDFVPLSVQGKPCGRLWIYTDITDYKRARETLRESEQRLGLVLQASSIGTFEVNLQTGEGSWNDVEFELLGLKPNDAPGNPETFFHYVHPDDIEAVKAKWTEAVQFGELDAEFRVVRADGQERWLAGKGRFLYDGKDGNQAIRFLGVNFDITERKRAEEALQESEERHRRFYESNLLGVIYWNMDGSITSANDKFLSIVGYSREELTSGQIDWLKMTPPEYQYLDEASVIELKAIGVNRQPFEKAYIHKNGTHVPVIVAGAMLDEARFNGVAFILDITDRKRAEEALTESEEEYRNLFENMTEEVHFWQLVRDEQGRIKTWRLVDANPPTIKTWGRMSVEEIRGKTTDEIFGPGATEHYLPVVQKIFTENTPHSFENYFPHLDKHFRFTSVPLGEHFITTGADITVLKKAELALRESEERLRLLGDNLPESAVYQYTHEPDGTPRFMYFSVGMERLNGIRVAEVLADAGTLHRQILPEFMEQLMAAEAVSARDQSDFDMEVPMRRPDGEVRWMRLHSRPRRMPGGNVVWDGVQIDITERKQAEEQIKAQLSEKDAMLREIHHRVKNNLQVISSLVSMQADTLTDERTRQELGDVSDRIRSMALVHERLYQGENLAKLDFGEYAARMLHALWNSHGALAEKVRLNLEVGPLTLPIETAIPCGLILNELAVNSLKHAFPDGRSGEVRVGVEHDSSTNTVCLRVGDNGVGLPVDRDWQQSPSLGLRLVRILTGQLRGTVETGSGPGAEFRVKFSLKGQQS